MSNWIEHYQEPKKLYLAWQAPDQLKDRFRWAVGEIAVSGDRLTLRYFRDDVEFAALNHRPYAELVKLGYGGYPAFGLRKSVHVEGVADVFMRRLPPGNRPDFGAYKSQFRIPPTSDVSVAQLLSITEAKLPSDGFSVVDALDDQAIAYDLMLEVAGYRYYAPKVSPQLNVGRMIEVRPEFDNPHDPQAVVFMVDGEKVGNLNRLQVATFRKWLTTSNVTAVVERLNGRPDHPRLFLFVRMRARSLAAA